MHRQVNKSQYTDNTGSEHTVLQQLMVVQAAVVLMRIENGCYEKRGNPGSAGSATGVTSSVLKNAEHGSYGVINVKGPPSGITLCTAPC